MTSALGRVAQVILRILFVILLVLVGWLSLMPNPETVPGGMNFSRWIAEAVFGDISRADKVSHFIAYGVLAGTAVLGRIRLFGSVLITVLLVFAFSGAIELAQGFAGPRQRDAADLVANALGLLAGTLSATGLGAAVSAVGRHNEKARQGA